MSTRAFHPLIAEWFAKKFGEPTAPQREGWPEIAAGRNVLIAAPTGSGKTLAAFLVCLDRLWRQWVSGELEERTYVVYVSPLKALSNDIERNLKAPLAELEQLATEKGMVPPPLRVLVRTGDTTMAQRAAMLKRPPHILVTTPESLYLLITSAKSREKLRRVETVIVDEIHALARDKRGSHLALTLERLAALCERPPVRIGLSATQRPMEEIARFLVGAEEREQRPEVRGQDGEENATVEELRTSSLSPAQNVLPFSRVIQDASEPQKPRECTIVDAGHMRTLDLDLELPQTELAAVCSLDQWAEVYTRIVELVNSHRSTLIFVNTRRLAERVAHHLSELLGPEAVASHHGSLSKEMRLTAEQKLKQGELKAIVATASLELGIDIGYIDLVCQIGSPRSIATFLQRVGRAGHSLHATPKGRLFPLTRDELMECLALLRAVRRRELDRIEMPVAPLDILAQQIIAEVACGDWEEDKLFELVQRAWPYRNLARKDFDDVVQLVSEGVSPKAKRGAYVHRDQIHSVLRARRGARAAAIGSGGAIPEAAEYRVVAQPEGTLVGKVDEDFAIESMAGDVFLLGNTSWRILNVRGGEVNVYDAEGAPPTIPFWFGEAPGRTIELSGEISNLRGEIAAHLWAEQSLGEETGRERVAAWLAEECGTRPMVAIQAVRYVEAEVAAIGLVPTREQIVFERFFDESGGMQLVIHSCLGIRVNRAWGLAMRKRFCRSFDFELQAAADDDGILLSIGPQHSFPIDALFKMLGPHNGQELLEQAVLAVPMFGVRWRWNATRALAVLRSHHGKKVPPFLQKFRAEDLLASVFPETVGCLENHSGDIEVPDHPLVRQTMHDCCTEAMDVPRWLEALGDVQAGRIELIARETREPSPFAHEIIHANPYAFLDDAPLEERRTRAVNTRRGLGLDDMRDLGRLDPAAIDQVTREAWPEVRDLEELHDALANLVAITASEAEPWRRGLAELTAAGRVTRVLRPNAEDLWIAAERWPVLRAVYPSATAEPIPRLPAGLDEDCEATVALGALVRGRMEHSGPLTAGELAGQFDLREEAAFAACEALEGQGLVMRGRYRTSGETIAASSGSGNGHAVDRGLLLGKTDVEWCERRLLARIHRLTLDGLRRSIKPVEPADFVRFLTRQQRLLPGSQASGAEGVREVVEQMQGFELPAGAWEQAVLAARVGDYDPQWLDHLFLTGELVWGRLRPPPHNEEEGPSQAALRKTAPIALALREHLPWLLPADRASAEKAARAHALQALEVLQIRGALFFQELARVADLLPAVLEEALRELAALGLATSDTFAAVRAVVVGRKERERRRLRAGRARFLRGTAAPIGRWSLFPGTVAPLAREEQLQKWCYQLLRRYGVVFRDLLVRESAAPSWGELVRVYRRLELRGEIRGGRFISGVAGEQFATESAVSELRKLRDEGGASEPWIAVSAADPLNFVGTLIAGARIPALHTNTLILQGGRLVAAKVAGSVEFFSSEIDLPTRNEMLRALRMGRRSVAESHGGVATPALRAAR